MAPFPSLLAFTTTVLAATLNTRQTVIGSFTDNFDDLPSTPAAPELDPVTPLNGLIYKNWLVASPGLAIANKICLGTLLGLENLNSLCFGDLFRGLKPQSGEQLAATGLGQDLLQVGNLNLVPYGTIAASDDIGSFDLISFYFGCLQNTGNSLVIPTSGCTISVTGFYKDGSPAPAMPFSFAPTKVSGQPLQLAKLPVEYSASPKGLKNITMGIAAANLTPSLAVLDIDDVKHVNRKK